MSTYLYRGTPDYTVTRTNLHPNPRYIGIDAKGGGGSASWGQEDVATGGPDGGGWTRITPDADSTAAVFIGTDQAVPVTPGETYTMSSHGMITQNGYAGMSAQIWWYDAADVVITANGSPAIGPMTAGEWYRVSVTADPPANAVTAQIRLRFDDIIMLGDELGVAMRLVEETDTLGPYFDGDTRSSAGVQYAWTGPENASPSTRSTISGGAVQPDLVMNYAFNQAPGTTLHRPITGGPPLIVHDSAWTPPTGTYEFLCVDQETALAVVEVCTVGSVSPSDPAVVTMETDEVPPWQYSAQWLPRRFIPTDQVQMSVNTPFTSWTVRVPYEGLS